MHFVHSGNKNGVFEEQLKKIWLRSSIVLFGSTHHGKRVKGMQNSISLLLHKFQALVSIPPLSPPQSSSGLCSCLFFSRGESFHRARGVRREEITEEDIVTSAKIESSCLSTFLIKGYIRKFQGDGIFHTGYIAFFLWVSVHVHLHTIFMW